MDFSTVDFWTVFWYAFSALCAFWTVCMYFAWPYAKETYHGMDTKSLSELYRIKMCAGTLFLAPATLYDERRRLLIAWQTWRESKQPPRRKVIPQ
jgi:hypothetical protein